jgi:hypothetical protein
MVDDATKFSTVNVSQFSDGASASEVANNVILVTISFFANASTVALA